MYPRTCLHPHNAFMARVEVTDTSQGQAEDAARTGSGDRTLRRSCRTAYSDARRAAWYTPAFNEQPLHTATRSHRHHAHKTKAHQAILRLLRPTSLLVWLELVSEATRHLRLIEVLQGWYCLEAARHYPCGCAHVHSHGTLISHSVSGPATNVTLYQGRPCRHETTNTWTWKSAPPTPQRRHLRG